MFGYVRPLVPALRVCDHELYKGMYCGLCRALGQRYGLAARFLVNYDLCFLALFYSEETVDLQKRRCMAHPFRKRTMCMGNAALSLAADATVLVSIWKLRDNLRDKGFFSRLTARCALGILRRAGQKAEAALPKTAQRAKSAMERLWTLEDAESDSPDAAADCFAALLSSLAESLEDVSKKRIAAALLYQLGRWIYLTDAADDLPRDLKNGDYNPLIRRFSLETGWTEEAKRQVLATLSFSRHSILGAAALWPPNITAPVWTNILEDGLPAKENQIFDKAEVSHEKPL